MSLKPNPKHPIDSSSLGILVSNTVISLFMFMVAVIFLTTALKIPDNQTAILWCTIFTVATGFSVLIFTHLAWRVFRFYYLLR